MFFAWLSVCCGLFAPLASSAPQASETGAAAESVAGSWRDEAGFRSLDRLRRGINFGNAWEAPPRTWGTCRYGPEDFRAAREAGFDHVRLPVAWHHYMGAAPAYAISPEIFAEIDALIERARAERLAVILDWHHFDRLTETLSPEAIAQWHAGWAQIARHYRKVPPSDLVFELLNEPRDAATTERMNELYPAAIKVVRAENKRRTILVSPGGWGGLSEVPKLRLPRNITNVIATGHCYDPFLFTHQGASWTGDITRTVGVAFPGPPARPIATASDVPEWVPRWVNDHNTLPAETNPSGPSAFVAQVVAAAEWSRREGRAVHVGEFGAIVNADPASRAHYAAAMRAEVERHDFGWAWWDWKAAFAASEKTSDGVRMNETLRAALIPERAAPPPESKRMRTPAWRHH